MQTVKQRTERIMSMTHGQLVMHCQDLTAARDKLKEALEFCAGTSYIDDAHRIADEALKESA